MFNQTVNGFKVLLCGLFNLLWVGFFLGLTFPFYYKNVSPSD